MTPDAAARAALVRVGVADPCVEHIRTGTNAVFRCEDMAVRVSDATYDLISLYEQVDLVDFLVRQGFPTPIRRSPVMDVDGAIVSCWQWIESMGEPSGRDLGSLLRHFHDVASAYPGRAPEWAPQLRAQARIDDVLVGIEAPDRALLEEQLHRLLEAVDEADLCPTGLIHGDVHAGNVIVGAQGCQLIDFERFCRGPLEWDLTQQGAQRRFFDGSVRGWDDFITAYGEVHLSPHFDDLVELRALIMTTWLLTVPVSPAVEREREIRLDYWRRRAAEGGPPEAFVPWSPV